MQPDKKLHFIFGAGIACFVILLVVLIVTSAAAVLPAVLLPLAQPVPAALLGLLAGERAGWVKEYVWDAGGRGAVDRADYLYTARGAVLGAVLGALIAALLIG